MLIALNKPYGVVCQFSPSGERQTLKDWVAVAGVYPAGRLDHDSEGLVLLTDEGRLQHAIAQGAGPLAMRYWVQVDGIPDPAALVRLREGVVLADGPSRPLAARLIDEPAGLWPRTPPIRTRRNIPTAWLEIVLGEGRNRQVRRTTAAIGHPTVRLIRAAVGPVGLAQLGLAPGQWVELATAALGLPSQTASSQRPIHEKRSSGQPRRGSRR